MPRPDEGKKQVKTRMDALARERLAARLIENGFFYERDGVRLPAWGEFLEEIEKRGISIVKNVEPPP